MRKNRTSYWPFSLSLSLSFGTFHQRQLNFHEITLKLFVSSHFDQRSQHVYRLYKQCVDLNEHSGTFGQRLHLATRSQSHSLSSSTSRLPSFFFLFFLMFFIFIFLNLFYFFLFLDFIKNFIMSFFSPFIRDNRSENVSRFCL